MSVFQLIADVLTSVRPSQTIFTGSRAWGLGKLFSDYDYVMLVENWRAAEVVASLQADGWAAGDAEYVAEMGLTGTVPLRKVDVNLILTGNPKVFEEWAGATGVMSRLVELPGGKELFRDRGPRVAAFKAIREALRAAQGGV